MNSSKRVLIVIMAAVIAIAVTATYALTLNTNNDQIVSEEPHDDRLVVFTTFYPIHEFTKNVVGDKAVVENLIPFNVEPHDYEILPKTLTSLIDADVLVFNGANFEPFVRQIIDSRDFNHLVFVETSKEIKLLESNHQETPEEEHEEEHEEDDEHGHSFTYDPHVWLDPILAKHQVWNIADAMSTKDPKNSKYYQENAQAYSDKLDALDSKIREELSSCKKDTFIPFHNAFTYFAERYNLKIKPLTGVSPNQQSSAKEIAEFIEFAKNNDIKYFFTEEMIDTRLAKQLANEAGGGILLFSPIEGITPEEQNRQVTYFDKMEDNLENLKIALDCS